MYTGRILFPLFLCAIIAAFPTTTITSRRRSSSEVVVRYDAAAMDTVSSPASLAEERMLQGPQQTILEEASETRRNSLWKQMQKKAKARARSSAQGMGFGSAKKGKGPEKEKDASDAEHSEYDPNVDKKARYGAVIMDKGVARVNKALSDTTAAALLEYINRSLAETQTPKTDLPEEELYKQQTKFSDVLGKHNRWDMLLPLEESDHVMQAMWELLDHTDALSDGIKSILGPFPKLYELGTLISDPGSERQMLHADYNFNPE